METVNNVEKQGENRQKYLKTTKMSQTHQKCRKKEETVNNVEKQRENRQKYRKTPKMSKIPQKCQKTEKTQ